MKPIRFIHLADIHNETKKSDKVRHSWNDILKYVIDRSTNIALIAGDFWNSPQEVSGDSATNPAIEMLQELANKCPVIIIKGNRQHDEYGSLEILGKLKTEYNICICESVATLGLYGHKLLIYPFNMKTPPDLLVHCFSYPEKGYFLQSKKDMGIDEANEAIGQEIAHIFLGFAAIRSEYPEIPAITMFHGNVTGAKISNGQVLVSQDIIIPATTLKLAGSDYYALGHIHEWQKMLENMYYSGSIYHNNFGEVNPKKFIAGQFEGRQLSLEHITINSIPLSLHELYVNADGRFIDKEMNREAPFESIDWKNAILRVRLSCTKEQRLIATDEVIKALYEGAKEYKIEYIQTTEERKRSDEISNVKHLRDKLLVYCKAKDKEVSAEALEFADKTEAETANE